MLWLQVDSTHLELADLLIVVLRSLCGTVQRDTISQGVLSFRLYPALNLPPLVSNLPPLVSELFLSSQPLSCYIQQQNNHVDRSNHTPSASLPRHKNRTKSARHSTTPSPVVSDEALKWLFNAVQSQQQPLSSSASDTDLLILLVSVLEGACCRSAPKNSSQASACLQTLSTLTVLLEELKEYGWIYRHGYSAVGCSS